MLARKNLGSFLIRPNTPRISASPRLETLEAREVPAAVIAVTNLADAGDGSLRAAIVKANTQGGADEIVFEKKGIGVIKLTSGPLVITDDVTINSAGKKTIGIQGNKTFNLLTIDDSTNAVKNVVLKNLELTKGQADRGGALLCGNENVTLEKCTVTDNKAAEDGGGIHSTGGSLTLIDSQVTGNTAGHQVKQPDGYGGFYVYNYGTAGGILKDGGVLTIKRGKVDGNTAFAGDGGITALDAVLNLTDTSVSKNKGKGLSNTGIRDVTLTRTKVDANSAGGLSVGGSHLTLDGSFITNNKRDGEVGGGVAAGDGATVDVSNTTISGNKGVDGAGVFLAGNAHLNLTDSKVTGNVAKYKLIEPGYDGEPDYESPYGAGGGIYAGPNSVVAITRSTISGNEAFFDGGGLMLAENGRLTLIDSTISGNQTGYSNTYSYDGYTYSYTYGDGGGLWLGQSSVATILRSTIASNSAENTGGGLFLDKSATVTMTNSTVSSNKAGEAGGGILLEERDGVGAALTVNNSTIAFNRKGGVVLNGAHTVTITSSIVAENTGPSDIVGTVAANYCLVQTTASATLNGTKNIVGVDPLLKALASNGGLTQTHALKNASQAIDKGDNPLTELTDQRGLGFARKLGLASDIGAFELK